MSRTSKNARNLAKAREFSRIRKEGGRSPSRTNPQHGKKNAWWQKFNSYGSFLKGGKKGPRNEEATGNAV